MWTLTFGQVLVHVSIVPYFLTEKFDEKLIAKPFRIFRGIKLNFKRATADLMSKTQYVEKSNTLHLRRQSMTTFNKFYPILNPSPLERTKMGKSKCCITFVMWPPCWLSTYPPHPPLLVHVVIEWPLRPTFILQCQHFNCAFLDFVMMPKIERTPWIQCTYSIYEVHSKTLDLCHWNNQAHYQSLWCAR